MGSQGQRPQKEAPKPEQTLPHPMALFMQLQISQQELKFLCFFSLKFNFNKCLSKFPRVTSHREATDEQGCNVM